MSVTPARKRVVIVGAGISGLSVALALEDLAKQRGLEPPEMLVLESEPHVGGKIRTIHTDEGFTCEWGVNGFLNKEPRTLELCQRLGLQDRLLPAATVFNSRYIYTRGKLRSVPMHPLKFMFSSILPFSAKVRLIRELWVKPRQMADSDESVADFDESVADFARRRVGPVAYQVLVDPMQTGIFAGDPERMSVASCFPRVVEVEQQYGSLIRGMAKLAKERRAQGEPLPGAGPAGHLTSFRGGMQTLVDRLSSELGERVRCGAPVRDLRREDSGYVLYVEGMQDPLKAEAVVLACPAYEASSITEKLDDRLSTTLSEISYSPLVVVCLGFPRLQMPHPMQGFGFLVPRTAGLRILGALWTSSLFVGRAPEDQVLIRVMIGGARDPDVLELDDRELTELVRGEIGQAMGDPGIHSFARIFRHRCGIPQYTIGHADRLRRIESQLEQLPGLIITGNAYLGIGVNDCARNAWPVAERVVERLASLG